MAERIAEINGVVNGFVWGWPMLILLVGVGIFITFATGFFQVRKFGHMMKNTLGTLGKGKRSGKGISPFQAVSTALAGTIGTGNIVGVTSAIVAGGPGAVFWMWVSAFFGMMTKFAEVTLAVYFRNKDAEGIPSGGPMYYIEKGLKMKWMAVIFALLCTFASFGIGNMTQVNSIAGALHATFNVPVLITGLVVAAIVALVGLGGIKRIAKVTELLVPFMAVFYIIGGTIVLVMCAKQIPAAFGLIFKNAFNLKAAAGGAIGYTLQNAVRYGFARGVFSNEAGLGSAPIAHASADTDNPVRQGLWGMFEVFVDTLVVCSFTALVILTAGGHTLWSESGLNGAALATAAYTASLGKFGGYFLSVGILFFALSTILGWAFYGERSLGYITKNSMTGAWIYRIVFVLCIVLGATIKMQLAWDVADTLNGMMAIPNLIALIFLSGTVFKLVRSYLKDPDSVKMKD